MRANAVSVSSASRASALAFATFLALGAAPAMARDRMILDSVSPASGPAGVAISVTGFGFTGANTAHFGPATVTGLPIVQAIGIMCSNGPGCRSGIHQRLEFTAPSLKPGAYRVWIENENGRTRAVTFRLTQ